MRAKAGEQNSQKKCDGNDSFHPSSNIKNIKQPDGWFSGFQAFLKLKQPADRFPIVCFPA
ncbi:MAG: hypothetical protein D6714_05235 [Bacteroidetes bacterium]|nr:MAG: hypothetical protein D6714_05235 [Bacteroidota bacterium]